jgi:hypothetical protein
VAKDDANRHRHSNYSEATDQRQVEQRHAVSSN